MLSFDYSPTVYWLIGYILAGAFLFAAYRRQLPFQAAILLGILLLFVMRLPAVVLNRELNPDESQMLSHAITLLQDPLYWRSVDGTTIGPLDIYTLAIPGLLGFEINYSSGRFMGLICTAGALTFLFFTLKNWFGEKAARSVWPVPLILLAFTQEVDFVHYSSEQVPVLLLALCVWILSRITAGQGTLRTNAFLLGLAAGAVPFGKLQAVPQALVLALGGLLYTIQWWRERKDFRPMIALLLGGISFPAVIFASTLILNVFNDMIDFYILGNAIYADGKGFLEIPSQFINIVRLAPDFQVFSYVLLLPAAFGLLYLLKSISNSKPDRIVPIIILLSVAASIYAATKSGNDFIHYLNFCITPWTLLAAFGIYKIEKWAIAVPAALVLWFGITDAIHFIRERKLNNFYSIGARTLAQSPVVQELNKYKQSGDYMAVWGWQCSYYVEAQLAEATAENHSERSIFAHPMRMVYRERYMSDLHRTQPAFILDAVGKNSFWVQDKKTQGVESYPALNEFVKANYRYIGEFDGTGLYVRTDRAISK